MARQEKLSGTSIAQERRRTVKLWSPINRVQTGAQWLPFKLTAAPRPRWSVTMPPTVLLGAVTLVAAAGYIVSLLKIGLSPEAIATVVIVGVAALLSSVAGFAFSAICGAMVFQFRSDTVTVVQIMLVCSTANQAMSVWALRNDIQPRTLLPFLAGGAIGVPIGIWLLLHLNAATFAMALGCILVVYGGYMLFRPPIVLRRQHPFCDVIFGMIGGLVGGFAATPGAPVSIWCATKGWDKTMQRALFQPFILIMQVMTLTLIAALHAGGRSITGVPPLAWACVPAGIVGTWWGLTFFRKLSDGQFAIAINLLLIASGVGLAL